MYHFFPLALVAWFVGSIPGYYFGRVSGYLLGDIAQIWIFEEPYNSYMSWSLAGITASFAFIFIGLKVVQQPTEKIKLFLAIVLIIMGIAYTAVSIIF